MRLQTNTAGATRRSINKIINMVMDGKIDVKTANCVLYGCNIAINAIKTCEIETKISEIEDIINGKD